MGMPLARLFGHCCKLPLNPQHQRSFNAGISSFPHCATHATSSLLLYLHSLLLMSLVTLFVCRCIDFDWCFAYRCFVTPVWRWFFSRFFMV